MDSSVGARSLSARPASQFGDRDPLFGAASNNYGGRGRYGESARPIFGLERYVIFYYGDPNDMAHLLELLLCYKIT